MSTDTPRRWAARSPVRAPKNEKPVGGGAAREGNEHKRYSQATQIVRAVTLTRAEFFHTPAGDPYVTVPVEESPCPRSREAEQGWASAWKTSTSLTNP